MPRIAVVGAGIAGLTAALTLQDAGLACAVYEASDPAFGAWLAPTAFQAILPPTSSLGESTTQASGSVTTNLNTTETNGTYWIQLSATAPQALTARGTVVKNC